MRRTLRTLGPTHPLAAEATGLAAASAALWAVHPLASECVVYATQRTESLMAGFYLLTLYAVARSAAAARPSARRGFGALAVAACLGGAASKEVMVTAPLVVWLYDASFLAGSPGRALRRRAPLYLGLAASWLLLAWLQWPGTRPLSAGFDLGVRPETYLANQAPLLLGYLKRVVWPHPLIADYGWPRPLALTDVWAELLLMSALLGAALWTAWRRPRIGFAPLAALIVLAPTSTILPIVTEVGAERRMYLPLAALLPWAVAGSRLGLGRLAGSPQRARRTGAVALLLAGLALASVSRARVEDYRSAEALWRTVVAARPDNPRGLVNLGDALRAAGQRAEARALFRRALVLHPPYARAEAQLALLAEEEGDLVAALAHLESALERDPRHGDLRTNLGELLARSGRVEEALAQWRRALEDDPELAYAANNLAWWLASHPDASLRDGDEALRLAARAVEQTAASEPEILDTLGAAYAELGRFDEARAAAGRALAMAERRGDEKLAAVIRGRRDLYARGIPARQTLPPPVPRAAGEPSYTSSP